MKSTAPDDRSYHEPDDDMTIGELADRFGLATHVLRHWESVGLLAPRRHANGRRRYTFADAIRVGTILRGKEAGFELEQLRAVLAAPDPSSRQQLLRKQRAELDERIAQATAARELIECALDCAHEDLLTCPHFQSFVQERVLAASPG